MKNLESLPGFAVEKMLESFRENPFLLFLTPTFPRRDDVQVASDSDSPDSEPFPTFTWKYAETGEHLAAAVR